MKKALITGICGQDGAFLSKLLLSKGYSVFGIDILPDMWRLKELGIEDSVEILSADITDLSSLIRAVSYSKPDEIYHLASQSFVGSSFDHPIAAGLVTGIGTTNVLEAVRFARPDCRVYNAATSELYGDGAFGLLNENSPMTPSSPYAIAKMYSYQMTRLYREAYQLNCCNGILFNHESELRGEEFVTRKISLSVAKIYMGLQEKLYLGRLDTERDWGYAPEYVESMWMILQNKILCDYVCATGASYSVKDFCEEAFSSVGLNWMDHVEQRDNCFRPQDVTHLCGDSSKIKNDLGWKAKTRFKELVNIMVEADIKRISK